MKHCSTSTTTYSQPVV